ncbi:N-acyl-phosphatidylethanolamine-hydrolyzing phospholipase D [Abortiporus biennis]|nr:N-acyl-phosphatidylethanolamine-hydrolyzing phospholipase D [Abortiporus biennis]
MALDVVVQPLVDERDASQKRPSHHANNSRNKFVNPWSSFAAPTGSQLFKFMISSIFHAPKPPTDINALVNLRSPDWGRDFGSDEIKATWLGHACFLVEFPTPKGASRGPRILFDPVFSPKCSPISFLGPTRYTQSSTDSTTLKYLFKKYTPHVFAPLGNDGYLKSICIPDTHIHTSDWWDSSLMSLTIPSFNSPPTVNESEGTSHSNPGVKTEIKITCTPSQHTSNRGLFDRWSTLWSSWVIESCSMEHDGAMATSHKKVYFAGDTGYRKVHESDIGTEKEDKLPMCTAFKEIGERFGGFDLALIPIGAYMPRDTMSGVHAHPKDSVQIFKDVKAKKGLGMHWGTWVLTLEPVMEPPQLLKEECARAGIPEEDFDICGLGETRAF